MRLLISVVSYGMKTVLLRPHSHPHECCTLWCSIGRLVRDQENKGLHLGLAHLTHHPLPSLPPSHRPTVNLLQCLCAILEQLGSLLPSAEGQPVRVKCSPCSEWLNPLGMG